MLPKELETRMLENREGLRNQASELSRDLHENYKLAVKALSRFEDRLKEALEKFFDQAPGSEKDIFAFGILEIDARIKSFESIQRNLTNRLLSAWEKGKTDNANSVLELIHQLRTTENPGEDWCMELGDLVGVRIIVQSQRQKYQVYRALRYISDLNRSQSQERNKDYDYRNFGIPDISSLPGKTWKYFNPPIMRSYYRPQPVQEFNQAIKELTRYANIERDANEQEYVTSTAKDALRRLNVATKHGMSFEFKDSGYASLQTNMKFCSDGETRFVFEVQIRTPLEHAWAEPEHSMIYKGTLPSEGVRGLFRSYGLSLSSSDDILQMVIDEWRRESDYRADYSDRALRMYAHTLPETTTKEKRILQKDLDLLRDSLNLGHVGDAIAIAQSLGSREDPLSPERARFWIEEAVCRMCALISVDDDANILELLNKSIAVTEIKEIEFWALFRRSQYYFIRGESDFVDWLRQGCQGKTELFNCKRNIEGGYKDASKALETYNLEYPSFTRGPEPARVAKAEILIILSRAQQWFAHLSRELPDQISELEYLERSDVAANEAIAFIGQLNASENNNVDIEAYNCKLWCLRLKHQVKELEFKRSGSSNQALLGDLTKLTEEANLLYEALLEACGPANNAKISNENDREVRQRLYIRMPRFLTKSTYQRLQSDMKENGVFELRVLDTIVGLRTMRSFGGPKDEQPDRFNEVIRKRLVNIASKGEFSFNLYFAFSILAKKRLETWERGK